MKKATYEIISAKEYCDCEDIALSALGGCSDYGDKFGLGVWQYEIEITVKKGEKERDFLVIFQPEERTDGMRNYSGYGLGYGVWYGLDCDESQELEEFLEDTENGDIILEELKRIALKKARDRLEMLLEEKEREREEEEEDE